MRIRVQDADDGNGADHGDGASLGLTVNVHVRADTAMEVTTYPEQGRVAVAFEGYRRDADVTLFLDSSQLRELCDLLTDTLTTLTTLTENADADPTTGRADDVRDRAA